MKTKPAHGIIKWFLTKFNYHAITMPWQTIYILPHIFETGGEILKNLMAHEMIHIDQIRAKGAIRFTILYLWYNVTRGYQDNPFEVEARERSKLGL